jgi:hypothetical protein
MNTELLGGDTLLRGSVNTPFICVGFLWVASCFADGKEERKNVLVLYDFQYGNTERIAQVIADELREFGEAQIVL